MPVNAEVANDDIRCQIDDRGQGLDFLYNSSIPKKFFESPIAKNSVSQAPWTDSSEAMPLDSVFLRHTWPEDRHSL